MGFGNEKSTTHDVWRSIVAKSGEIGRNTRFEGMRQKLLNSKTSFAQTFFSSKRFLHIGARFLALRNSLGPWGLIQKFASLSFCRFHPSTTTSRRKFEKNIKK